MIKQVTIQFGGYWFGEDTSIEPEWTVTYTGLFESYKALHDFILQNFEDPWCLDELDYLTSFKVLSIRMIDEQAVDFDRWELKV